MTKMKAKIVPQMKIIKKTKQIKIMLTTKIIQPLQKITKPTKNQKNLTIQMKQPTIIVKIMSQIQLKHQK